MALDNAEFISELSIVDPPGTDPLNQGDDHIRTTKKAVQQSFPNVGSAVPQTGQQMAQMAIKNEVNTFTADQILSESSLSLSNLSQTSNIFFVRAGAVDYSLQNVSGQIGFRRFVGGVSTDSPFKIGANGFIDMTASGAVDFSNTTLRTNPSSVANDSGIAMIGGSATLRWLINHKSNNAGNNMDIQGFDGNGTFQHTTMRLFANSGIVGFRDGTAGGPAVTFISETNTGMYRVSASIMGWAVSGARRMSLSNQTLTLQSIDQIRNVNGTATAPAYGFADTTNRGMYSSGTNRLGISTAGIQRMDIGTTRIQLLNGVEMPGLPTTNPGGSGVLWKSGGFIAIT